jgi:hypothetical protein
MSPHTVVPRLLEQCGIHGQYTRWRYRLMAPRIALHHFSLAKRPPRARGPLPRSCAPLRHGTMGETSPGSCWTMWARGPVAGRAARTSLAANPAMLGGKDGEEHGRLCTTACRRSRRCGHGAAAHPRREMAARRQAASSQRLEPVPPVAPGQAAEPSPGAAGHGPGTPCSGACGRASWHAGGTVCRRPCRRCTGCSHAADALTHETDEQEARYPRCPRVYS